MRLLVIGAGGHAKVVVDAALASGLQVVAAIGRDGDPAHVLGVPVVHEPDAPDADAFIVAVGDNRIRLAEFRKWTGRGLPAANVVHPSAVIAPAARLDEGVFVAAGAVINPAARIGADAIINTGCVIEHDCMIGAHSLVGPSSTLCGGCSVGEGVLMGAGATLIPGVIVGPWATVGAGAVVTRSVAEGITCVGVPAHSVLESES